MKQVKPLSKKEAVGFEVSSPYGTVEDVQKGSLIIPPPKQLGIKIKLENIVSSHNNSVEPSCSAFFSQSPSKMHFDDLKELILPNNIVPLWHLAPNFGVNNFYSCQIINGFKSAMKECDKNPRYFKGLKFRLIGINDQQDPIVSKKIVRMISLDQATSKMFFGNCSDECIISQNDFLKKNQFLQLFPLINYLTFDPCYMKNLINGGVNNKLQIGEMLHFLAHVLRKAHGIVVVLKDSSIGRMIEKEIVLQCKLMKMPLPKFIFHQEENGTFVKSLEEIRSLNPKVLILMSSYLASARIISYLTQQKLFDLTFIGTEELYFSSQILKSSQKHIFNLSKFYYCSYFPPPNFVNYKVVRDYLSAVELLKTPKKFQVKPSLLGLSYYVHTKVFCLAMQRALNNLFEPWTKLTRAAFIKHQNKIISRLVFELENMTDIDLGGFLVGFDRSLRCPYYLQPNVIGIT